MPSSRTKKPRCQEPKKKYKIEKIQMEAFVHFDVVRIAIAF
jgi:hypothetical protein